MDDRSIQLLVRNWLENEIPSERLNIPIIDPSQQLIGKLALIDNSTVSDIALIEMMTRWRNRFMRHFMTQFVATEKRTSDWLKRKVLVAADRLLFVIYDATDRPVGHAGICNLNVESAELDNFIRGESGGAPNLLLAAELSMLKWIFCHLKISMALLHVFSNNWIPIAMHQRIGFEITNRFALNKITDADGAYHVINSTAGQRVPYSYLRMNLDDKKFFQLNPSYRC
jgi:hypothetical protein